MKLILLFVFSLFIYSTHSEVFGDGPIEAIEIIEGIVNGKEGFPDMSCLQDYKVKISF